MPVTTQHPQYTDNLSRWQKCRDAASGQDAVKARRETYLPKLSKDQEKEEYDAYLRRAVYFNATGRTKRGMIGMAFRKAPVATNPSQMQAIVDDATMEGRSLVSIAKRAFEDALIVGRAGILVEYPVVEDGERTLSEAEKENLRPYLTYFTAESITDWKTTRINGAVMLSRVILKEAVEEVDLDDEFKTNTITQYRVLDLADSVYRQRVYRRQADSEDWKVHETHIPTMRSEPMRFIPFVFIGPEYGGTDVQPSPIEDLADMNLSHYRTMADLENGRHWCGSPTPFFFGDFQESEGDEVTTIKLGSETGHHMTENSSAQFLEFTGGGLEPLENADKDKSEKMVVLGARILAPEQRKVETAETASIHRAGENSVLASIAMSVSRTLVRLMEILADWAGLSGDVSFQINTDFVPGAMPPDEIAALVAAWQAQAISHRDLFIQLKKGERIEEPKTYEQHQEELENESPLIGVPA